MTQFLALRGPVDYAGMVKAFKDFGCNQLAVEGFGSTNGSHHVSRARPLVRPGDHSRNIENKVDSLAEDLGFLTLLIKKQKSSKKPIIQPSAEPQTGKRLFSYCREPGHGGHPLSEEPGLRYFLHCLQ